MANDPWGDNVKQQLAELGEIFQEKEKTKSLGQYFESISENWHSADLDDLELCWYRHKRRVALRVAKEKQNKRTRNDRNIKARESQCRLDVDNILSQTDSWDLKSWQFQVWKDDVQQCLEKDQDFFKPQVASRERRGEEDFLDNTSDLDDKLDEAEHAFNLAAKDASGAHRLFSRQTLALKLRLLEADAEKHCAGRPINSKVPTYLSEKRWSNLPDKERDETLKRLVRWRREGEKWLSLKEPAIVLALRHIPRDHQSINTVARGVFPTSVMDAVIRSLRAMEMIHEVRQLWRQQLARKGIECFDAAAESGSTAVNPSHFNAPKRRRMVSSGGYNRRTAVPLDGQSTSDQLSVPPPEETAIANGGSTGRNESQPFDTQSHTRWDPPNQQSGSPLSTTNDSSSEQPYDQSRSFSNATDRLQNADLEETSHSEEGTIASPAKFPAHAGLQYDNSYLGPSDNNMYQMPPPDSIPYLDQMPPPENIPYLDQMLYYTL